MATELVSTIIVLLACMDHLPVPSQYTSLDLSLTHTSQARGSFQNHRCLGFTPQYTHSQSFDLERGLETPFSGGSRAASTCRMTGRSFGKSHLHPLVTAPEGCPQRALTYLESKLPPLPEAVKSLMNSKSTPSLLNEWESFFCSSL